MGDHVRVYEIDGLHIDRFGYAPNADSGRATALLRYGNGDVLRYEGVPLRDCEWLMAAASPADLDSRYREVTTSLAWSERVTRIANNSQLPVWFRTPEHLLACPATDSTLLRHRRRTGRSRPDMTSCLSGCAGAGTYDF